MILFNIKKNILKIYMCISILEKLFLICYLWRFFNFFNEFVDLMVEIKKYYMVWVFVNFCGLVYLGDLMKIY